MVIADTPCTKPFFLIGQLLVQIVTVQLSGDTEIKERMCLECLVHHFRKQQVKSMTLPSLGTGGDILRMDHPFCDIEDSASQDLDRKSVV